MVCFSSSCDDNIPDLPPYSESNPGQKTEKPELISSTPADGATNVLLDTPIEIEYSTDIILKSGTDIKINGESVEASVSGKKLILNHELSMNTTYKIDIPATAISNNDGEFADAVSFSFTTYSYLEESRYEAENASLTENASIETAMPGFSGTGYVSQKEGDLTFKVVTTEKGKFRMHIRYSNDNNFKANDLLLNGDHLTTLSLEAAADWEILTIDKIFLNKGENIITIKKNWGWTNYDYIEFELNTDIDFPFNIASGLVNPSASTQAKNLYNFLKENFGNKVISGVMADTNSGFDDSDWVYNNTGKYTALIGFDFIDYTREWSWVDKSLLVPNSQSWWNEKGIVTLSWHWRDPSHQTGEFYTDQTDFDITAVNNPESEDYKAMIRDIDIIAGYLKQLEEAGVPILWRPLHEAAGKWFWWGAKGADPCKKLWILMYERLVNHHGLNNLIWVWTSDTASDALDWYPGDDYVDIVGLDIYPGERQHGSQYISFDKAKEIFGGRKLLTLSECGSIPDPDKMFDYGDTWSWFMPWNGEFTREDKHNGATFLNGILSNDKVITRDKMPNLN